MSHAVPATVVHIPHASQVIPQDVVGSFVVSPEAMRAELLLMTDHFTDELFYLPSELAATVVFPISRLVVDPERFVDDAREPMAARGMGVIYTRTSHGVPLRTDLSTSAREELLSRYYRPHHRQLSQAIADAVREHGGCLVIDGHSFASRPLPHEYDQRDHRPDICIGTDDFHTPGWLADLAATLFREQGFTVEMNRPFAGTIVPEPYYQRDRSVLSVMIEINRARYMLEDVGERRRDFQAFYTSIRKALSQLTQKGTWWMSAEARKT